MIRTQFLPLAAILLACPALAADVGGEEVDARPREPFSCLYLGSEYSIGAIIVADEVLYRCVSTFDENLERQMAWVKIEERGVAGTDVSIYML